MQKLTDIHFDFLPDPIDGIYLVGGCLRDMLIGRAPRDIDLAVEGDPSRTAKRIAERTGGRMIDLGKKDFAVFRIVSTSAVIDITPLAGTTITSDLNNRDFTLNALAFDLKSQRLVDCTGGLDDIRRGIIRMVADAAFIHDPARLVRAYRMAAELKFNIAPETQAAIKRHHQRIVTVAGERVWAELVKIFKVDGTATVIRNMATSSLLTAIFPELESTMGCTQNHHHRFDVFEHSLRTCEAVEDILAEFNTRLPDLANIASETGLAKDAYLIKYGALLHDVGKPATRQRDAGGRVHFHGHANHSASMAAMINQRLRLSAYQQQFSDAIIRHHIRPLFLFIAWQKGTLGPHGQARFFRHCGHHCLPIVLHAMADTLAKNATPTRQDTAFIDFCHRLGKAFAVYRHRQRTNSPLINGRDLIAELGLPPGPQFKRILNRVNEQWLAGTLTSREQALAWVRRHLIDRHLDDA